MFARGSRYRNLPESSPVNAEGEYLRGKDLRIIARTPGQFLHTVSQGDRLDLVALKYYGDPTKWWQISDANSAPFPTDLLDRQPLVEETFVLACPDFDLRFTPLLTALSAFGEVRTGRRDFFDRVEASAPDFLESTVTVLHDPLTTPHAGIVTAVKAHGFRLLRTFAWTQGTLAADAFTFDDDNVKGRWDQLMANLARQRGVQYVQSEVADKTLTVSYNATMVRGERQAIVDSIRLAGFAALGEPRLTTRLGTSITVPPNQIT